MKDKTPILWTEEGCEIGVQPPSLHEDVPVSHHYLLKRLSPR